LNKSSKENLKGGQEEEDEEEFEDFFVFSD